MTITTEAREGSQYTEYDSFTVEYRDASHRYWLIQDDARTPLTSVTSALSIIDKPQLIRWAEDCGARGAATLAAMGELDDVEPDDAGARVRLFKLGADAKRDAGADRGTIVHAVLEAYSRDGTVPNVTDFEPNHRGYVQGLCAWLLKANPTPVAIEQVIASPRYGFAGRADLVADINGFTMLCDLKTNPAGRVYDEAHIQTAGYTIALNECGYEPLGALVVSVSQDGSFTEEHCCASPADFLSVLDMHRRLGRLRKDRKAVQA